MASVTVLYFGMLRELSRGKKRQERLEIDDRATLAELIEEISERNGPKFRDYIFDASGKLKSALAFAVNGDSIESYVLNSKECRGVKEFVILPPISGG